MNQRAWILAGSSLVTSNLTHALASDMSIETSATTLAANAASAFQNNDLIVINARQLAALWPALEAIATSSSNVRTLPTSSGQMQLNPSRMTASIGMRQSAPLTSREYQILSVLDSRFPEATTRDQIVSSVWGVMRVTAKAFDVHLVSLRRKLKAVGIKIQYSAPCQYSIEYQEAAASSPHPTKASA